MPRNNWQQELYGLAGRLQWLEVAPDLAGMGLSELWGVYCYQRHVMEG